MVYSSNSGVCPDSCQPDGLIIFATLMAGVFEFTLPINSSMIFGGSPAAGMTVGDKISFAIVKNYIERDFTAIGLPFTV
jgi:hypothetical protein